MCLLFVLNDIKQFTTFTDMGHMICKSLEHITWPNLAFKLTPKAINSFEKLQASWKSSKIYQKLHNLLRVLKNNKDTKIGLL